MVTLVAADQFAPFGEELKGAVEAPHIEDGREEGRQHRDVIHLKVAVRVTVRDR